jgi:hypothetical protein
LAGETTSATRGSQRFGTKLSTNALTANVFTVPYLSTETQLNDVMEVGYIPAGVTVIGFFFASTDLDTGSPAVVQQILLGSTALVSGITCAQGGTADFFTCTPTATTAATLLKIKTTTAAATGAAGTVYLTPLYVNTIG